MKFLLPRYKQVWPIYSKAGRLPDGWPGWPDGKKFAFVLTHDVETMKGQQKCKQLVEIERKFGFRSAFYFVPERYQVSPEVRKFISDSGFEVGVHGLKHDGKLYSSREEFDKRALKIKSYLKSWGATGFSSPCMQHNLDWIDNLEIKYDISTYDTDPFEPQGGGIGTIFPFCVKNSSSGRHYAELQYTLPQDFTLFILTGETSPKIWKDKLDWIVECGGMAHLKTHPDYMCFDGSQAGLEEYRAAYYEEFLDYVKSKYEGKYWHCLPKELAQHHLTNALGGSNHLDLQNCEILCPCCKSLLKNNIISFLFLNGKKTEV